MVYVQRLLWATYTKARRTRKTQWTCSYSLMPPSQAYPCVTCPNYNLNLFCFYSNTDSNWTKTELNSTGTLRFSCYKENSVPVSDIPNWPTRFSFIQLGCHEIAPPTSCVRDAIFLRVGAAISLGPISQNCSDVAGSPLGFTFFECFPDDYLGGP